MASEQAPNLKQQSLKDWLRAWYILFKGRLEGKSYDEIIDEEAAKS